MRTEEVTIDLTNSEIMDLKLEREGKGEQQVQFSVEGKIRDVNEQIIEDALLSNIAKPISLSLEIERPETG